MYHRRHVREARPPSRYPRLEFWLTLIVVAAVVVTLLLFVLVYHDVPFRPGGGAG